VFEAVEGPALPPTIREVVDGQGVYRLVNLGAGGCLQLLATGSAPFAAVIPLDLEGFDRLESLYRLLAAIHRRSIPPDRRVTSQQRARMTRMLRAYDGARDGATQQEIARVLMRLDPLDRDAWQDSSARHAIKSLLRDARAMIAGGYLRLLGHSQRN
jgi:hypothetical protein